MRAANLLLLALLIATNLQATAPGATPNTTTDATPNTAEPPLRGMTISCPWYGAIWDSSAMSESLADLRRLGVAQVAIHPYAGVRRDGSMRIHPAAETGYLDGAARRVREAGLELFWKPHLAYWGSFAWRGDITFPDDATWRRFFANYREWILDQARFAERHKIPRFAVGVELERTLGEEAPWHEAEWRDILAAVRKVYSGRLVYAANWDRLDAVTFWDAVDEIGVQAYFPLSYEDDPDEATLRHGWQKHFDALRRLSERYDKPVLFAEIGYDLAHGAAREPWQRVRPAEEDARELRSRLMRVALEEVERQPFIRGMFWWKWMPGDGHDDRDFPMSHPDARETLRQAWADEASAKR